MENIEFKDFLLHKLEELLVSDLKSCKVSNIIDVIKIETDDGYIWFFTPDLFGVLEISLKYILDEFGRFANLHFIVIKPWQIALRYKMYKFMNKCIRAANSQENEHRLKNIPDHIKKDIEKMQKSELFKKL